MTMKTFDLCALPEVCFHSIGNEPKQAIQINKDSDYEDNFIELNNSIRDDRDWLQLAGEYKSLKADDKKRKKRMEQIKDALVSMSETACSTGGGLTVEKCVRKGAIQFLEIPEVRDLDLEKYRGESVEYWKVTEV